MIIGIDHGYYAMKTKQVCFPTGLMRYTYEPYTMQNVLQYGGVYYVCGTGRQTLVKDKTANDNYYLLTLAALAQEIRKRKGERTAKVVLAAGLPLAGFGRENPFAPDIDENGLADFSKLEAAGKIASIAEKKWEDRKSVV